MKIKIDKNLQVVADRAEMNVNDMSYVMANALLNAGLIKADEEYYGVTVAECNGQTPVATITDVMHEIGVKRINNTTFDAFASCIILGDGDCPECGGEMGLWDCKGREISNIDRYLEPTYIPEWEEWRCPICGHIIERDYRND